MTPEFYLKYISKDPAIVKSLYEVALLEVRGKIEFEYKIIWARVVGQSKLDCENKMKEWAKKEKVVIIDFKEVYTKIDPPKLKEVKIEGEEERSI
jgi:hypothetical protein